MENIKITVQESSDKVIITTQEIVSKVNVNVNEVNPLTTVNIINDHVCEVLDAITISNSSDSYSVDSSVNLELTNIDFTDSDGTTRSIPSMEDIVCTPCIVRSGIAYQRPLFTGQVISYRVGDDGWHLVNGTYNYTPPINPLYIAELDNNSINPTLTLKENNEFGNKDRWTDINGLQVYSDNYVIDHLTGLGYSRIRLDRADWNTHIDLGVAYTGNGFNDWRIVNLHENINIYNYGQITMLVGSPFTTIGSVIIITSTTRRRLTARAWYTSSGSGAMSVIDKVKTVYNSMYVRNHYN